MLNCSRDATMKYLYQDSVKLPIERDFILDLTDLLKLTVAVYPLENGIIAANKEIESERHARDRKVARLDAFERDVGVQLGEIIADDATYEMKICKDATSEACTSCADEQRAKIESDFDASFSDLTEKIDYNSGEMRKVLAPFLESGVYDTSQRYSLASEGGGVLHGEFEAEVDGLSFVYELEFKEPVLVKQLVGVFSIPIPERAGLFQREDVLKMRDISNHRMVSVEYTDEHTIAEFKDRKGEKAVRIEMQHDTNNYSIVYGNAEPINLTKDESILKEIDSAEVIYLMQEVIRCVKDTEKRGVSMLKTMAFDGVDVIEESIIFDGLKVVFAKYGKIASECIAHGAARDELVVKIESENGARSEKYMPISTIESCLSEIGEKGIELAGVFGMDTLK
ncbi:MAG: hypothetical protein C4B59_02785 [Candidatus Methanogaster sp.]|uniref:Uncharacterized protein n=1 Tax=Candidatus Methanogaster sp. TaxID=3386292 RepID=A0AC61L633_9EURY|nr:MAG: hypothetical protein C4B59_02785 [ANME-2 cluster archaeon]